MSSRQYTEKAFETAIEDYLLAHGYQKGDPETFDRSLALDPGEVIAFIKETQPKDWNYLESQLGTMAESRIIDDLSKALNSDYDGCLKVIRQGFKSYGRTFRIAYFAPASSLNPDTIRLYEANRLTITRQLHYSEKNENSLDVTILINGIPVITIELKNPMTGQSYADAIYQYQKDRDPKELIFQFKKRTFVHFAADPEEVWMTTRLDGPHTRFIPFNKGNNGGKGNPPNGTNYKTAYLWEEILARDSLLDILARFIHLQKEEKTREGRKYVTERIIFPRYHQLQAVRNIISDARERGPGQNYLIQHSAGSGKSNTIGWLAHRLVSLHNDEDIKVFDSVVVVTDRVVLDRQLQDTIYQFEHKTGVVQKIDKDSTQLASALEKGTPIIITTLQKFPVVTQKIGDLPKRTYAVIIDEAHSSQSGESAIELKGVLAKPYVREKALQYMEEHNVPDSEDLIIAALERGYQPNISFFAFTATPKYKTLCAFGRTGPDGKPEPFHLYSMRQAIEEQFILDVLAHYTTYKTYYKLVKSIEEDPEVDRKKAAKALARFMALHPVNISQKTEVMVEHYQRHVMHKIGGRAKAMVVADSRLAAVRYKQAFDHYIAEHQYPIKTLVAFSGEVTDKDLPEVSYTEVQMNGGIREKEVPERFASDEYHILIVAEKYQTGFDQPLLHTMYLDKRVAGVQAVQTLSRLNRVATGKEDTFVLDFINTSDEIKEAFQPFYEVTMIQDKADEGQLNDLRSRLLDYQIFYLQEIEEYSRIFFKNTQKQSSSDHAILNSMISQGKARYDERPENEREEFKKILGSYLRLYSFMSQVLPYPDLDLEKIYAFGRAFANAIRSKTPGEKYRFDDDVALKYYRLQKLHENFQIELDKSGGGAVKGPTDVGTGVKKGDRSPLSKIIEILNERFGTEFTEADQLFFDSIQKDAASNEKLKQAAQANDKSKFGFALRDELKRIISGRMESNEKIVNKFFESEEFKEQVTKYMIDKVYEEIIGG